MKKTVCLVICLIMAMSACLNCAYALDDNGVGEVYYTNDFSTAEKVSEMNSTATFDNGTMKLPGKDSAYILNFGSSKIPNINSVNATIEINFIIKSESIANWTGYMLGLFDGTSTTTGARACLGYTYNGIYVVEKLKDGTGSWDSSVVLSNSIAANQNHKLCMVMTSGQYDLYLDGNKITASKLNLNSSGLTDVTAINYMNSGNYLAMHFDDILVKEMGTMALRSSTVADGAADVSVNTQKLELKFENPLTSESKENITVSGLTKDTDYTVEIDQVNDARTAVITFNNALEQNTSYTVNYNVADYMSAESNGEIRFTTEANATPPEPVETTVSAEPASGATNVNAYSPIVFTYNKNIDTETVPAELTLSNDRKANITVSGKTISVLPVNPLAASETITVTLPDTIKDAEGEAIPTSTTTYTTMEDSVYFAHIFRDRDNPEQTTSEFPKTPYLVEIPQSSGDGFTKGNGLIENGGTLTLIYKLDQGIDCVETMEYYASQPEGSRGSASYYIGNQKENLVSEENKIDPSDVIKDYRDNGTGGQNQYVKNIFTSDGTQKYFAVVVNGKNYVPQLQYVKFNQPKPETVASDIPTADGNSVTFTLNSRLDAESVSADKFKVDGESVISATASGNKLTLIFNALDFQKTYTVTAEGVTNIYGMPLSELKFITPKAIEVVSSGISEADLSGTTATGKATLKNNSPEDREVMVVSAYYDGKQMLQSKVKKVQIKAGETGNVTLEALDITGAGENNFVKVFVWLADTLQPASEAFRLPDAAQN